MEVPARGNCIEKFISTRKIQALLGFAGVGIIHGLMISLPVTLLSNDFWRPYWKNYGSLTWCPEKVSLICSSYFWGYLLSTQISGWVRYIKFKFSPKWVLLFAVLINIIGTLLSPVTVHLHYFAPLCLRFNMGVAAGMAVPALKILLSKWMLPEERANIPALFRKSEVIGFAVFISLTGAISYILDWEIAHYVIGGLSMIWCIIWIVFAQDTPQRQAFISNEERDKIVTALTKSKLNLNEPVLWSEVLLSKPFLSILALNVSSTWGLYMFLFRLPMYWTSASFLRLSLIKIASILSLSSAGSWLINIGLDKCLNYIQEKKAITPLVGRKITVTFATGLPAISLLLFCHIFRYHYIIKMTLLVFTIILAGSIFYGQSLDFHDISPNFADQLTDVTNIILIKVRILVPIVMMGLIHYDKGMFYITAVLYAITSLAYLIFGSVEIQPWNKINEDEEPLKDEIINA